MFGKVAQIESDDQCRYCDLDQHESPVLKTGAGIAVPSVGAMVEGWLIVFPSQHVLSLSELQANEWIAFAALADEASRRVQETYGPTVRFEHGSGGANRLAACGVDHAHLHIVPLDIDVRQAIAECDGDLGRFNWTPVADRVQFERNSDYIFVSDSTGSWVTRASELPSQVVRRAIAKRLAVREWDWKKRAALDVVAATRARLGAAA